MYNLGVLKKKIINTHIIDLYLDTFYSTHFNTVFICQQITIYYPTGSSKKTPYKHDLYSTSIYTNLLQQNLSKFPSVSL